MIDLEKNPWVISDTHFFHENIKKYCNRPDDWQERFIETWKKMIQKEDEIFHLGDLALAKLPKLEEFIKDLPGHIYMIRGNHDKYTVMQYRSIGIEILPEKIFFRNYVFTHVPLILAEGKINIHGHIHNNITELLPDHINVSIEVMNYLPVRLFDIIGEK